MDIKTTYHVKIKHYNHILDETVSIYRDVVNYCINVCLEEWDAIALVQTLNGRYNTVERMIHTTAKNPQPKYGSFDNCFYKLPSYLRRSAIAEAIGCVSSYKTRLAAWESEDPKVRGRRPRLMTCGNAWPCLYKGNMFQRTGRYTARIKVYIRNTWDWLDIELDRGGSKRQRLHLWKANTVQRIVTDKAHRLGMRVSRVCAWNTSRLAFDGSGRVRRGHEISENTSYSVCRFRSGKTYNVDLNAAYNIGARYFIRELVKSLPATAGLSIGAKVPRCLKRSTCTLADLINLCAALRSSGISPLSLGRMDGGVVRCV